MKSIGYLLIIIIVLSCNKDYRDNEINEILEKQLDLFLKKENIELKNINYTIKKEKYYNKENKYYQYNLTYSQIKDKDTIYITIAFFTDDGEIRIIDYRNIEYWKKIYNGKN